MKRTKHLLFVAAVWLVCQAGALAADLVEVLPVTNRILMLHFDEGHIDYNGLHQDLDDNVIYKDALDVTVASVIVSYSVQSPDDANYSTAQQPVSIGRKAKGADFNKSWGDENLRYLSEHWIYIELPFAMQSGKTYTLKLNNVAKNLSDYTFVYNEFNLLSPTVHINQIGFTPQAPKYAYLSQWMGDFNTNTHTNGGLELDNYQFMPFYVVRVSDNGIAYTGEIKKRKDKTETETTNGEFPTGNFSRADVYECDFSAFTTAGAYKIVVPGMGCSYPFDIDPDVYRQAYYTASKGLFFQRQGIHREIEPGWDYPRDHHAGDGTKYYYDPAYKFWMGAPHISRTLSKTTFNFSASNLVSQAQAEKIYGYYRDASDWDQYVANHLKTSFYMFTLYDMNPESFADGDVANRYKLAVTDANWINEGANGIPDLLDEAGNLVLHVKRLKDALYADGKTTGGVPGYVGREGGAGNGIPSWEDTAAWCISAEDPVATMTYAGAAAWYASALNYFWQQTHPGQNHPDFNMWKTEATNAYNWAIAFVAAHPAEYKSGVKSGQCVAAALLYKITQNTAYQSVLKDSLVTVYSSVNTEWSGADIAEFAMVSYALLPADFPGLDVAFQTDVRSKVINKANNDQTGTSSLRGYRIGFAMNRGNELGQFSTPRTLMSAAAYEFTADPKYLELIYANASYTLGGNELNRVKITGLGDYEQTTGHHIDAWTLIDYNSKVYRNNILPGFVLYEMDNISWVGGPGDERWGHTTAYPPYGNWPVAETRFDNRNSINGSEYTHHQTMAPSIFTYGYLCGNASGGFTPNAVPTISGFASPASGASFNERDTITLKVNTSSDVQVVKYYYEEHYIGQSSDKANKFPVKWNRVPDGTFKITAVAYDDKGLISRPSSNGEITLTVNNLYTPPTVGFTAPTNGQTFTAGSNVSVTATATDDGSVTKVEFFLNGFKVAEDNTSPYTCTLNAIPDGSHQLKAWATDNSGEKSSATVTFGTTRAQTPYGGVAMTVPGIIETEHFDVGGEGISYHDISSYNEKGVYRLEGPDVEIVNDMGGNNGNITGVAAGEWLEYTINVTQAGNYPIAVRYTTANAGVLLDFYLDDAPLALDAPVPQATWWPPVENTVVSSANFPAGTHVLKVVFDKGLTLNYIRVGTATYSNPFPVLTSPANDIFVTGGSLVPAICEINPADADGIQKVEFYNGVSKIGEDASAPYVLNWTVTEPAFNGTVYMLTAKAIDNAGNFKMSPAVKLKALQSGISGPDTYAPSAPANVRATGITQTGMELSWTGSIDNDRVSQYDIYANGAFLASSPVNSYMISGLDCGASYSFYVKAKDPAGNVSAASSAYAYSTAACPGGPAGLVHQWKFNNSYLDEVGTSHGTPVGGTGFSSIMLKEGSHSLDPAGAYLSVGQIDMTDNFTLAAWVYNPGNSARQNYIMGNKDASGWGFAWYLNSSNAADGKVYFETKDASGASFSAAPVGTCPFNQWVHLVVRHNGSTDKWTLFVNGDSIYTGGTKATTNWNEEVNIASSGSGTWGIWPGYLDNMQIYNRQLTRDEILEIMNVQPVDILDPTAPANLTANNITQTGCGLSWSASTDNVGVTGYEVFQDGASIASVTGTTYTVSGLTAGASYAFTVKAKDEAGNSSPASNTANVTTLSSVIQPIARWTFDGNYEDQIGTLDGTPTGTVALTTDAVQGSQAAVFNANGEVQLPIAAGFPVGNEPRSFACWVKPAHDNWTGAIMGDLFEYGDHHYNDFNIRQQGPSISVQENWGSTGISTSNIWVTGQWMHIVVTYDGTNAKIYKDAALYYQDTANFNTTVGVSTAAIGGGLKDYWGTLDDVRFYNVALNTQQISDLYNEFEAPAPDTQAPTAPTGLAASSVTQTSCLLNWNTATDNIGVTAYDVYKDGVLLATTASTSYAVSGLVCGTSYAFTVTAKDAVGNVSAVSNTAEVTTSECPDIQAPTAPGSLTVSNLTKNSLTLTWTASTDNKAVTGYEVSQDGVLIATVTTLSCNVTGLECETLYDFTVIAKDAAGNLSPASTANATTSSCWDVLTSSDFESGWGPWTDGGSDCSLYTGSTYAHGGTSAANIQDNSGVASSFFLTNGIDVHTPGYTEIKIDFWFYSVSMDNNEDFWVQYWNGTTWQTIATYKQPTNFVNGQFHHITLYVSESQYVFPSDMKIRFLCDASGDADDVYIDDVVISATTVTGLKSVLATYDNTAPTVEPQGIELHVFPNPVGAGNSLFVCTLNAGEQTVLYLFDMQGRMVLNRQINDENQIEIATDNLKNGIYILKAVDNENVGVTRFVVE